MTTIIKAGCGFDVGQDFTRAVKDTPIELAPKEHARAGHVIGYIAGDPLSKLAFMRAASIRVHVRRDALATIPTTGF